MKLLDKEASKQASYSCMATYTQSARLFLELVLTVKKAGQTEKQQQQQGNDDQCHGPSQQRGGGGEPLFRVFFYVSLERTGAASEGGRRRSQAAGLARIGNSEESPPSLPSLRL